MDYTMMQTSPYPNQMAMRENFEPIWASTQAPELNEPDFESLKVCLIIFEPKFNHLKNQKTFY